jgi:hypothetical protein
VRRWIGVTMTALLLAGASVGAGQTGKQKKHHGGENAAATETDRSGRTNVAVRMVFGADDLRQIRRYYAPRFSNLPPGLQKKVARGGSLPPGWQKKMEPFPVALERGLPPLPAGYSRGVIDAHAVIYNARGMIIDVAVLF